MLEIQKQVENINEQAINSAENKMNSVYSKQKQAMQEILAFIALLYFHYEINGSLKLNRAQKIAIFKELNSKLLRIYKDLGNAEKETLTDILKSNYKFLYDETFDIYNIYHVPKPVITEQDILAAVMLPMAGELFTERIWKNKEKTIKLLNKATDSILNDNVPNEIARQNIENIFNLTAYDTERLMTSEDTRVRAQASNDSAKTLGIKKHKWSAALEHTCKECRHLHGKVFDIEDKTAPTIPLHANCRCMWINLENNDIINERVERSSEFKVNKELINSTEYAIKFSDFGNDKLNNSVLKETKIVLKSNDKINTESMAIINEKGKVISRQNTGAFGGDVDLSFLQGLKENSAIITHNHPGSSSFSPDDIALLLDNPQIKTIVAAGHNGTVYKLSVGNGTRIGINHVTNENEIINEYNKLYREVTKDTNEIVSILAKKYNWKYEVLK